MCETKEDYITIINTLDKYRKNTALIFTRFADKICFKLLYIIEFLFLQHNHKNQKSLLV